MNSKMNLNKQKRARIVEVVGPAGAGKTTLCTALSRHSNIQVDNFPDVRKVVNVPFFTLYGLQVLSSMAFTQPASLTELERREFAWLSILRGWPGVLRRELKKHENLIFLDQGPVYLFSEMSLFGPGFLKREKTKGVWRMWYRRWADTLDAIVWLDAPDDNLVQRIRSRQKDHVVKDKSDQTIFNFLTDYRQVYEQTLSTLKTNHAGLRVLRFDTNQQTSEEIAAQLFVAFDLKAYSPK